MTVRWWTNTRSLVGSSSLPAEQTPEDSLAELERLAHCRPCSYSFGTRLPPCPQVLFRPEEVDQVFLVEHDQGVPDGVSREVREGGGDCVNRDGAALLDEDAQDPLKDV